MIKTVLAWIVVLLMVIPCIVVIVLGLTLDYLTADSTDGFLYALQDERTGFSTAIQEIKEKLFK